MACRFTESLLLLDIYRLLETPGHESEVHTEATRQVYQRHAAGLRQLFHNATFI